MRPHRWVVLVPYVLEEEEAAQAMAGIKVTLGAENCLWELITPPGCYHCEQPYPVAHGKPCLGEPMSYGPKGEPVHR